MIKIEDDRKVSKTLKYLENMDGSNEVIAMITSIREAKGELIVIR